MNAFAFWKEKEGNLMRPEPSSKKPKRPRGRPVTKGMPPPIPDTMENVARAIMQGPPKPKDKWLYLKERWPDYLFCF